MSLFDDTNETKTEATEENKPVATPVTAETGAPAPKRRGRPPGSKNRPKDGTASSGSSPSVPIDMGALPDEIVEPLALAPLILVRGAVQAKTTERDATGRVKRNGIVLQYDEKAVIASVAAFRKWLSSIDLNLSPGYAYLACMAVAFGSAAPMFLSEMGERAKDRRDEKRVNTESTPPPNNEAASNASETASAGNGDGGSAS